MMGRMIRKIGAVAAAGAVYFLLLSPRRARGRRLASWKSGAATTSTEPAARRLHRRLAQARAPRGRLAPRRLLGVHRRRSGTTATRAPPTSARRRCSASSATVDSTSKARSASTWSRRASARQRTSAPRSSSATTSAPACASARAQRYDLGVRVQHLRTAACASPTRESTSLLVRLSTTWSSRLASGHCRASRQSVVFGTTPSKEASVTCGTRGSVVPSAGRLPELLRRGDHHAAELRHREVARAGMVLAAVGDRPHRFPHRHVLRRDALDAGPVAALHGGAVLQVAVFAGCGFFR